MRTIHRGAVASGFYFLAVMAAGLCAGCVVHAHPGYAQLDLVDVNGYHHHGYYDDHHDWHGGWDDEHHAHHEDPHDWHR